MKGITLINFRKLILNKGSPPERHPAVDLRLVYIRPVTHMLLHYSSITSTTAARLSSSDGDTCNVLCAGARAVG